MPSVSRYRFSLSVGYACELIEGHRLARGGALKKRSSRQATGAPRMAAKGGTRSSIVAGKSDVRGMRRSASSAERAFVRASEKRIDEASTSLSGASTRCFARSGALAGPLRKRLLGDLVKRSDARSIDGLNRHSLKHRHIEVCERARIAVRRKLVIGLRLLEQAHHRCEVRSSRFRRGCDCAACVRPPAQRAGQHHAAGRLSRLGEAHGRLFQSPLELTIRAVRFVSRGGRTAAITPQRLSVEGFFRAERGIKACG